MLNDDVPVSFFLHKIRTNNIIEATNVMSMIASTVLKTPPLEGISSDYLQ